MLDVVKYRWQNSHGAWIGPDWMTVPSDTTDEYAAYPKTTAPMRVYASSGKPGLKAIEVLDRKTLPEHLRQTGRSGQMMSYVILYFKANPVSEMSAEDMIAAMAEVYEVGIAYQNQGKEEWIRIT